MLTPVLVVLLTGALAGPAQARPAQAGSTVPIPQHPAATSLTLLGASANGLAVQQDAIGNDGVGSAIFTGPEGTQLSVRPLLAPSVVDYNVGTVLAVVGKTVAWYRALQRAGSQPKAAHRTNLLTGADAEDGEIAAPGAFNGESWFSDAVLSYADFPSEWQRPLRRYHAGTAGGPAGTAVTDILIPNVHGVSGVAMAADRTAVLRATTATGPDGAVHYYLDLVNLGSGAVQRLLDTLEVISAVALTADSVVWVSRPEGGPLKINQRPRGGGVTSSYTETDQHADVAHLVAGPAGVGYLVAAPDDPFGTVLRVVTGATALQVALPLGGSGLAEVGTRFLTATGGAAATAGVYSIAGTEVSRVATVPSAQFPPQSWSFSASQLRYTDESEPDQPGLPVWQRTVSGANRAKFSTESQPARTAGPIAFSAGRGVVGVPGAHGVWQLLDRGEVTGVIEASGATPNVSGPYTEIGGKVFRPDGELIYTEPTTAGETSGQDDLFGSKVIFSRIAADNRSEIWLDDAEQPHPVKLDTLPAGCADPQVSIWGELVAWATACGTEITVRNVRLNTTRVVPTPSSDLSRLQLSEGTLTWTGVEDHVLDLTTASSQPVTLAGIPSLIAVDDHRVARQVRSSTLALSTDLQMSRLPFTPKYAPRLISRLGPLGFTPDGDGHADTWTPEFDVSKPLRKATLKITTLSGATTLQVLTADGADGSLRGLLWDGRTSSGATVPTGTYRWTLTGRAADGDGSLIAADGTPTVTGTIEIDATA